MSEAHGTISPVSVNPQILLLEDTQCMGVLGGQIELNFAVEHYLAVNRAEVIVLELFTRIKEIESRLLLATLDQFDQRIGEEPKLIEAQNLDFYLQQVFNALRERDDIASTDIAIREYRYLPLLTAGRAYSRDSGALELDKIMAKSPEFYVQILSDVFGPASERGQEKEVTERERAKAHIGWILLEGFTSIPGLAGEQIDIEQLKAWVTEVRRLAEENDRLAVAESRIGALLAHAPDDPLDKLWPHSVVRSCLEAWRSDSIEHGMLIERINMRGVTSRRPRDGGIRNEHWRKVFAMMRRPSLNGPEPKEFCGHWPQIGMKTPNVRIFARNKWI